MKRSFPKKHKSLNTEVNEKAWMHQWSEAIAAWQGTIFTILMHYLRRATPIGGSASPFEHCLGDTASKYTSWTTNYVIATEKALDSGLGGRGVILTKDFSETEIIASPDIYGEAEILIVGLVTDASIEWVP